MKLFIPALAALIFVMVESKTSAPKVRVYIQNPGEYGRENTLICHVSEFQPPNIEISLLKGNEEIPKANLTDLSFKDSWQFHLTQSVSITPMEGEMYTCRVTHMGNTKDYVWENHM